MPPCAGGVQLLPPLMKGAVTAPGGQQANQQLLYDAGLSAWQLTFHPPAVQLMPNCGACELLAAAALLTLLGCDRCGTSANVGVPFHEGPRTKELPVSTRLHRWLSSHLCLLARNVLSGQGALCFVRHPR